jgi:MFS family permease
MTAVPLRRNRDFVLLQAAQLLSSGGSQMTAIAYPLLVLALTGSPAKAGLVAFARLLAMAVFALPAGLAADHWSRRRLMLGTYALRALAIGTLTVLVATDQIVFWMIPLIAFVEGTGAALFSVAQAGAMRSVVPKEQLPAAVAVVTGREAAVSLAAPPIGGALFTIGRALPFLAHTLSYALATAALLATRTPFQQARERDRAPMRDRLAEGFRFLWDNPFQRTTAFLYGLANFIGPGLLLAVVVIGKEEGLSGGELGLLLASFAACLLLGSILSPYVRRALPVRGVLLLELWTWTGCALFLVWPSVFVLVASILPTALAIPSTDSVVGSYQLAMTPDRLVGRVESVRSTIALLFAPLGPLVAGALLAATSERATIAVFAATALVLALWGTFSSAIRSAPTLDELTELPAPRPTAV